MEAASAEFVAHGYRHASVDAISKQTGIGKTTIYRHFGDKAGLYRSVVLGAVESLQEPPVELIGDRRKPALVLRDIGLRALSLFLRPESIALHRMVIEAAPLFPDLARLVRERLTEWNLEAVTGYFSKLATEGVLAVENPEWTARQFLGLATHGNRFLLDPALADAGERKRMTEETVRLFLSGVGGD
ncbi:MAG TPA: TetR/AcrR family transcriptional regulator [Alphaproteobacteria bacterium]|nr:TetR/AcrR family transcriptional regulator [Alphaproteobacteria bacterium]